MDIAEAPNFSKFLYNKFDPFNNAVKEMRESEFEKFNIDSSSSVLDKKKFTIHKNKKNVFGYVTPYYDVLYKGVSDHQNCSTNTTIIENRIDNTFKFNSEKVIDSLLRSNKNINGTDNINFINDSFKYFSPARKVKNIFKNLKSVESREHSNSNSLIIDDDKINGKISNKKKKHLSVLLNRNTSSLENTSISNNHCKFVFDSKSQIKDNNYFKNISNIVLDNSERSIHSINSNLLSINNNKLGVINNLSNIRNIQSNNNNSNLDNSKLFNRSYYSDKNDNNKDIKRNSLNNNIRSNNSNTKKKDASISLLKSNKSLNVSCNSSNEISYVDKKPESANCYVETVYNRNFILKNIKLAKNYKRKKKKETEETAFKRNLRRKVHSLLVNDYYGFCENFKIKNRNFDQKISINLNSEKYENHLNAYHENFHFLGMSYNPARHVYNLASIEKNYSKPEEILMSKITPSELKIIQSDVNYFIKNKSLIKENPALKVRNLKEILQEEEEAEYKKLNRKKTNVFSKDQEESRKYEEKLKLIRSGSKKILKIIFLHFLKFRR